MTHFRLTAALLALLTLAACGGGGGGTPAPTPPSSMPLDQSPYTGYWIQTSIDIRAYDRGTGITHIFNDADLAPTGGHIDLRVDGTYDLSLTIEGNTNNDFGTWGHDPVSGPWTLSQRPPDPGITNPTSSHQLNNNSLVIIHTWTSTIQNMTFDYTRILRYARAN